MYHRAHGAVLSLAACLLLAGCGTAPTRTYPLGEAGQPCLDLFVAADRAAAEARVSDAGAARIPGFPWLRTDRFLASFRSEVSDPESFRDWLARLAELDREARLVELANLDHSRRRTLRNDWQAVAERHHLPPALEEGLDQCRSRLSAFVAASDNARGTLVARAEAPDNYNTWQRVLGLYPLAREIARPRVVALHGRLRDIYLEASDQRGPFRYFVADNPVGAADIDSGRLIRDLPRDALGIPILDAATHDQLLAAHAPVWGVEIHGRADLPGTPRLDDQAAPRVDTARGTEYRWLSWTRFRDEVLLQLNYLVWFTERPATSPFDLVAGELDGIIWRTSLDSAGRVVAHDSIHACGCYYALFPAAGWRIAPQPRQREPVFAPDRAPEPNGGQRLVLRLAAGTHYFIEAATMHPPAGADTLRSAPANELLSLPLPSGSRASLYDQNGLIPASRRLERFVLWPLGVPSPGTMRQPGTHAIAFVGRRHFDDAWLLDDLLSGDGGP